jgi:hypothetical protein
MDLTIGRGSFFRQARWSILNAAQRSDLWFGMASPRAGIDQRKSLIQPWLAGFLDTIFV